MKLLCWHVFNCILKIHHHPTMIQLVHDNIQKYNKILIMTPYNIFFILAMQHIWTYENNDGNIEI